MRLLTRSLSLVAFVAFSIPAFAALQARPGMVNYVEGNVRLGPSPLTSTQVGTACLRSGSLLSTRKGKAEILLTPGVYLRVGSHSTIRMVSPHLARTSVQLLGGTASVEVDEIMPENDLEILDGGIATRLVSTGYYEFDATPARLRVYSGKALVPDEASGRPITVKGRHMLRLQSGVALRPVGFNTREAQDSLLRWSRLRSQYLAQSDRQMEGEYAGAYGYNPGWYWNPYAYDYAFFGPSPYWGPFSWGFSPWWGGGLWGGGYWGGGFYGGGDFDGDGGFARGGGRR